MKKIQREETKVIYTDIYVSVDGKEFTNEKDCREWETSYKGTLEASWKLIRGQVRIMNATLSSRRTLMKLC